MQQAKLMIAALALLLLFGAAAQDALAQRGGRDARQEAEAGGWQAAYSGELTEQEARRGFVEPGLSIFAQRGTRDMMALHDWADELVRQAAAGLRPAAARNFSSEERLQARRFTVRTVRELLRGQQAGSKQQELLTAEVKAGLLEYKDRSRGWISIFVPYVALREKGFRDSRQDSRWQQPEPQLPPPVMQFLPDGPEQSRQAVPPSSSDALNALSLTNTARPLNSSQWEWTARIDGPASYLRRIRSVTYHLHQTFSPSVRQGDAFRPGHPLTATGWGVFELRAEVVLNDGARRSYRHMLRFR